MPSAESDQIQAESGQESPGGWRGVGSSDHMFIGPCLEINYEHRKGLGEDAPPICYVWPGGNGGLIGVFDGLGGAGGETIRMRDGKEHTGAWLASRLVAKAVWAHANLMQPVRSPGSDRTPSGREDDDELSALRPMPDFTRELRSAIEDYLANYAAGIRRGTESRLKSRLIKTLPTTMAISWFDLTRWEFTAIWAGDSRVYLLRPEVEVGLQQVTSDDLKTSADAMENLTDDSPMSNCISADTDFYLTERRLNLTPRTILLAASDGCFAYVRTPLHFERLLLETMQQAADWHDWQDRLLTAIKNVTGDDATLAAIPIGWPDFASCRRDYADRYRWCAEHVEAYDNLINQVEQLDRDLRTARQDLADRRQQLWEEYRKSYESPLRVRPRYVPDRQIPDEAPGPQLAAPRPPEDAAESGRIEEGQHAPQSRSSQAEPALAGEAGAQNASDRSAGPAHDARPDYSAGRHSADTHHGDDRSPDADSPR